MAKYVAIMNFKCGEPKAWKYYKIGDHYDGPNHAEFLKAGFLRDHAEVLHEESEAVMVKAKEQLAVAKALKDKADALKAQSGKAPAKEKESKA